MYDVMLIDSQWLLTRNFFAIRGGSENKLANNAHLTIAGSVISSIMKFLDVVPAKKVILLFDTYPYHKSIFLTDYKGTRTYTTMEDAENMDDEDENKEQALIDAHNLNQRGKAKKILTGLESIGLPSFRKSGYEADDLAYEMANRIHENNQTAILVSIDSDWGYWINPSVDWYSPTRGVTTYEDMIQEIGQIPGLSLYDYKGLYDSFYGSHNDLVQTVTDEMWDLTFIDFYKLYMNTNNKSKLFQDYDLFKAQLQSQNITNYPEYNKVRSMTYYLDKAGSIPTESRIDKVLANQGVSINRHNFMWYVNNYFDKSLFYD